VTQFVQLLVNGLVTGSILALAGVGVSLVYGILRVVNFAQGEYITYGAFAAFVVNVTWSGNIVLAAIVAVVAIAALGIGLELSFWRPMRRRRAGVFTMFVASLGLSLIMRGVLYSIAGPDPRTYKIDVFQVYDIHGVRLSESQMLAIVIAFVSIVLVGLLFSRTHIGRSMRALSDNRELAAVAGVNVDRIVLVTWVIAGGLAGLAGVLQGLVQSSFDANMGFVLLLPVFAAVVLGGIGSAYGALAGGLLLGIAMELSTWSAFGGGLSPVWEQVVAFSVLIAMLLVRPQGLLGEAVPA
jgi:branched-subunit amino acid ABC-type transport system permease component